MNAVIKCRICGCSDFDACAYDDGVVVITCYWAEEDLCSFCELMATTRPVDTITTGGVL